MIEISPRQAALDSLILKGREDWMILIMDCFHLTFK